MDSNFLPEIFQESSVDQNFFGGYYFAKSVSSKNFLRSEHIFRSIPRGPLSKFLGVTIFAIFWPSGAQKIPFVLEWPQKNSPEDLYADPKLGNRRIHLNPSQIAVVCDCLQYKSV